ncbi:MAG: membrane protein insertase YidC [Rhodothermales bacterium]
MDRNVVIATVLIAIIMFIWLWMLGPTPPAEPTAQEGPPADTQQVEEAPGAPDGSDAPQPDSAEEQDLVDRYTSLDAVMTGRARPITVVTDLYEATFSTKGATLTSFVLKEYNKFDQVTPVQMVDTTGQGVLGVAFTTPNSRLFDSRSLFFDAAFAGDTLRVEDGPASLTFETVIQGGTLRQTYTFEPGEYELGLSIEQDNPAAYSTREGYELVWDGGIPFTEDDRENEAQSAGAYARSGGEVESVLLNDDAYEEQRLAGSVSWVATKTKYFTAVMIPSVTTRGAELIGERHGEVGSDQHWEDFTLRLLMPEAGPEADEYRLYVGPMEFYRISDYDLGLYDMVDYGWDFFEFMTRPLAKFIFIPLFTFLSNFIPNYGVVIIIFAILIKVVLYPLTKTSYRSMARMRELQPKMEEIKEKYGDNPQKQQEAMMKMYKETGVNPIGGCLPMLLQYPIIISLWLFLPQSIEIRQQGFLWAHDLSAPDAILQLPFTIPLYGDFVAGFTLLMGISMVFQMRLQMNPSQGAQAKIFTYVFPIMIFAIFNRLAAGLSLYYLFYNVITAVQQKYINHQIEREQDGDDVEEKTKKPSKKKKSGGIGKRRKS